MELLADATEFEREAAALRDEMEVTAQMMRQAIAQNASMAMNQEEYVQRYQNLTERYTKASDRVKVIEAECAQRTRVAARINCDRVRTLFVIEKGPRRHPKMCRGPLICLFYPLRHHCST